MRILFCSVYKSIDTVLPAIKDDSQKSRPHIQQYQTVYLCLKDFQSWPYDQQAIL